MLIKCIEDGKLKKLKIIVMNFTRRGFFAVLFVTCFSATTSSSLANTVMSDAGKQPAWIAQSIGIKKTKLRLAQNLSPISGVTIVAKEKGFFEKQGLDVQIITFTSGKKCLETVLGGAADIATTAEAPTTAAAMANQPIAFLARMEYSDLKTLTASNQNIFSIDDLKGKRIGFTAGTGGEVYTMELLKKASLSPKDVRLVNLRPKDMLPALASGSIDAFNTWEPYISNGKKIMGSKSSQIDTKGIYSETFNIVTTVDYLNSNKKVTEKFLRSLIDAEEWIKANRSKAITLVAKTVGMNRTDLEPIWDDYVYEVVLDKKTLNVLNAHAAWRLESGNHPDGVKSVPNFNKIIFSEPLSNVAPNRVKFK